jgi:hypothetical protein
MPVTLTLLPGFADPGDKQKWSLHASIRLYADSSKLLASSSSGSGGLTIPAGKSATAAFALPAEPWPLGERFVPLGLLVARVDGRSWTREAALTPGSAASGR